MARELSATRTLSSRRMKVKNRPYVLLLKGGTTNYISLGSSFVLNTSIPFMIHMEVDLSLYYGQGLTAAAGLFSFKTDQGIPFVGFMQQTSTICFKIGGNTIFPVFVFVNPNRRNHTLKQGIHSIAVTFDGVDRTAAGSYRLYLDGEGFTQSSATISATSHLNTLFILGATNTGRGGILRGRVWNGGTAPTAGQVASLHFDDILPSGPTLVREYLITDGSGTQVTETVAGDHGTINGTTYGWKANPLMDRTLSSARTLSS